MQLSQSHEKKISLQVVGPPLTGQDMDCLMTEKRQTPHLVQMIVRNSEFQSRSARGETNTRRRPPIIITSPQSRDAPSNAPFPRSQQPDADTNTNTNTNTDTDTNTNIGC